MNEIQKIEAILKELYTNLEKFEEQKAHPDKIIAVTCKIDRYLAEMDRVIDDEETKELKRLEKEDREISTEEEILAAQEKRDKYKENLNSPNYVPKKKRPVVSKPLAEPKKKTFFRTLLRKFKSK